MQITSSTIGVLNYYTGAQRSHLAAYLKALARAANTLPWNVFTPEGAAPEQAPPTVAEIYTDLDTALRDVRQEEDLRQYMRRAAQEQRISLQELADKKPRLLILGDPGSGKSTFAKHTAYLLAHAARSADPAAALARLEPWSHGSLLPVYVELRDLAAFAAGHGTRQGSVPLFQSYLNHLLALWGCQDAWVALRDALDEGKGAAILLLDGLDEVGTEQRPLLVEMVNALAADEAYRRHRCIVTCRPYAYYDVSKKLRLSDFAEVMLAAFSPKQVNRFIDNWYKRLAEGRAPSLNRFEVAQRRDDLKRAVQRPDHRTLAQRPILLTMMVQLHTYRGKLPDDRIDLYKESVDLLLARWNTRSHGLPSLREFLALPDLKDKEIEQALAAVAFRAHAADAGADDGGEERTADIDEGELQTWVRPYLGGSDAKAAEFVQYIRERAGLLVRHKTAAYTFPHRSIQEYLAARCLVTADDKDYKEEAPRLVAGDPVRWREVFVLAAGCAPKASDAVAAINGLCPRPHPAAQAPLPLAQWTHAQIAATALLEIGEMGVLRTVSGPAVWERVQEWLLACLRREGPEPDARTRAEAGRLLAKLGDSRVEVLEPRRMAFCYVPAGSFVLGEGKKQHEYDVRYDYWISRYPVTVAQYAAFREAGGYGEQKYWPEAEQVGWWRNGKYRDRDRPYAYSEPFDLPNHPVVGVSWYEALAFVRWLNEASG